MREVYVNTRDLTVKKNQMQFVLMDIVSAKLALAGYRALVLQVFNTISLIHFTLAF